MKTKNVLVTGGLGFIGSNFIEYFTEKYPTYHIVNLDAVTYAANPLNLEHFEQNDNYSFIKGDIRNQAFVKEVIENFNITDVIHFAAESHVDNSINNPTVFAETNVMGTLNLLETARNHWQLSPFIFKEEFASSKFHHISTDEVFGTLDETMYFTEESNYAPNSPYSASKASSDMMVRSYFHTYGMNVVTSNCSNNYGPKQHDEKLIPTVIRKALAKEDIPIYGNGLNVRDWLFVKDHCKAIDLIFHKGNIGDLYLIGGNNENTNINIANAICSILDEIHPDKEPYSKLIKYVEDRHGHDFRYAIDNSKIKEKLDFKLENTFESGLYKTVVWYLNKYKG